MQSKNIIRPAGATCLLLLIAFFGNHFIDGFNWDETDFIIMGVLIFGTGLLIELVSKKIANDNRRYIAVALIILGLLWLWAELAVGVFTNWGS